MVIIYFSFLLFSSVMLFSGLGTLIVAAEEPFSLSETGPAG